MTSAPWDLSQAMQSNAATNRATCLARNYLQPCQTADAADRIAGRPPAPTARLRITLWRRSSRWRRHGALIQIPGRRRRRAKIKLHRRRFLRSGLRGEKRFRLKSKHLVQHVRRGMCCSAVLYCCTALLKLFRSTEMRFSVPSSCACKFWKHSVARSCG